MQLDEILDQYDNVKDDLKFFANSDVRAKILISLQQEPKDLSSLRQELNFSSSTILHGMYQLEDKNLIFKESGHYHLSQMGEICVLFLLQAVRSFSSMNTLEKIFLNHDIGVIPSELLINIECLENGYILESGLYDLDMHYKTLSDIVFNSKKVKFISSIFYPFYLDLLMGYDEKDEIKFILTEEIMQILKDYQSDSEDLNFSKISFWQTNDDLKLSFTVTDEFIVMGLFLKTGVYDSNRFFICEGPKAVNWGNQLFNYYLTQSTKVKL